MSSLCESCCSDCPVDDRSDVQACQQHWPKSRGTTHGQLMQMHEAAEIKPSDPTPKHYDLGGGKDIHDIECAIWGAKSHSRHLLMAAFEYIARADKKGSCSADIGKAIHCLSKAKKIIDAEADKPLTKGAK